MIATYKYVHDTYMSFYFQKNTVICVCYRNYLYIILSKNRKCISILEQAPVNFTYRDIITSSSVCEIALYLLLLVIGSFLVSCNLLNRYPTPPHTHLLLFYIFRLQYIYRCNKNVLCILGHCHILYIKNKCNISKELNLEGILRTKIFVLYFYFTVFIISFFCTAHDRTLGHKAISHYFT